MASITKRGDYWRVFIRRRAIHYKPVHSIQRQVQKPGRVESNQRWIEACLWIGQKPSETRLEICFCVIATKYPRKRKAGALEILRLRKLNADPIAKLKVAALTGKVIAEYRDRRLTGSEKSKSLMALPNKAIDPKEESAMLERHFARQRNWCALAA